MPLFLQMQKVGFLTTGLIFPQVHIIQDDSGKKKKQMDLWTNSGPAEKSGTEKIGEIGGHRNAVILKCRGDRHLMIII